MVAPAYLVVKIAVTEILAKLKQYSPCLPIGNLCLVQKLVKRARRRVITPAAAVHKSGVCPAKYFAYGERKALYLRLYIPQKQDVIFKPLAFTR